MSAMAEDRLLKPQEAAQVLGVSVATLAARRSDGKGPPYIKAGQIRYLMSDLKSYIGTNRVVPGRAK